MSSIVRQKSYKIEQGGWHFSFFGNADNFRLKIESYEHTENNTQQGIELLELAESALLELNALANRLKELGVADTLSTNTTNDTAALNAEASAVSDTIDSIVSSLTFNNLNILGTSAQTFNIGINDAGDTQTIKSTIGITATNISDATNSNNSADTALGEITQSLGNISGGLTALKAYQNVASSSSATLLEAASNLLFLWPKGYSISSSNSSPELSLTITLFGIAL